MNLKHGMEGTPTYTSWAAMKGRCNRPRDINYSRYGGRGIKVCTRWSNFSNFLADMGERPSMEHQLERIDNDGDYTAKNCRWATRVEQARNRRSSVWVTYRGETQCLTEWASRLGMKFQTLKQRLGRGWTVERAFTESIRSFSQRLAQPDVVWIRFGGEKLCLNDWARRLEIRPAALAYRLKYWSVEEAVTTPKGARRAA